MISYTVRLHQTRRKILILLLKRFQENNNKRRQRRGWGIIPQLVNLGIIRQLLGDMD